MLLVGPTFGAELRGLWETGSMGPPSQSCNGLRAKRTGCGVTIWHLRDWILSLCTLILGMI